jgi:hypothetical protein
MTQRRFSGSCCEYGIECFASMKGSLYVLNCLNPSGYFMNHWFHVKQSYILPVKYISNFAFISHQY